MNIDLVDVVICAFVSLGLTYQFDAEVQQALKKREQALKKREKDKG